MTARKLHTAKQIAASLHDYGTSQLHADAEERLLLMDAESKTAAAEKKRLELIISRQRADIERLTKQNAAYMTLNLAQEKQLSFHRAKAEEYQAAADTLDSEREANRLLTQDVERSKCETERLREQFDPDKFVHRPDCCGATIDTHCMGCTMAEQTARAEEVATLRSDRNRLRAALVGIVGDDDPASMTTTRAVLAAINMACSGDAIAAIDALMDIRP